MSTPQWVQNINALNTSDTDLSTLATVEWASRMKTESDKFTEIFKGLSIPLQNAIANAGTAQTLGEDAADKRLSNLTRADAVANLIQLTPAALTGVVGQGIRISNSTGGLDATPINTGATISSSETTGDPFYIVTLDRKDTFRASTVLVPIFGNFVVSITPEPPSGTAENVAELAFLFIVALNKLPTGASFSRTRASQSGDVVVEARINSELTNLDGRLWRFNLLYRAIS